MLRKTLLVTCLSALTVLSFGQGPLDNYYITSGNTLPTGHNIIINHLSTQVTNQANGEEFPIAVYGDVRTANSGQVGLSSATQGAQYDLAFNYTGTNYSAFALDGNDNNLFYDGTTDGKNNYVVSYGYSGKVYSTDRSWGSLTPLFKAGTFGTNLGITYDGSNNSLWISNWTGSTINDYSMSGVLLGSFSTGIVDMTSLALDPRDGTLWFGSQTTKGTFYQYSRGGAFLQSDYYANLANENTLGGEFNLGAPTPTPEPFTLALGALGIATAIRRRMRRP